LDEGMKDYSYLKNKCPNDKALDEKINKVRNKKKIFFEAFCSEGREKLPVTIEGLLKTLKPNPSYVGPVFPEEGKLTHEWVLDLINHMKDPNNKKSNTEKYIDKVYLLQMLLKARNIFMEQKEALIDITIPDDKKFTVVGDIHGQFYDLLKIFEINGYPSEENPYLFNGNYVDRGVFSLECVITLIAFKILYPNHLFMARGNHENASLNQKYGFREEVIDKYGRDGKIFDCFTEFFKSLPLGHILNKQVLVVHGGLFSKDGVTIDEIKKIDRFKEIPESGLMCELLWSDPCKENGRFPSKRGVGICFGPDVAKKFLAENELNLLIRSHEVKMSGFEVEPGGKVITVFSAPNYCDKMRNQGAILILKGKSQLKPEFRCFTSSPHPNIPIEQYMTTPYLI
jgi:serine/threonine-protein phosphatase 5